jgi:aspartate/methionine/tyrosine aminotransferase
LEWRWWRWTRQALNQRPFTFFREVLALLDLAPVKNLEDAAVRKDLLRLFAPDAIDRAVALSKYVKTGAYSDSQGVLHIRETVARFLHERDGTPMATKNLFLSNGASECIQHVLGAIIAHERVGIMIPVPQYPLCVWRF